MEWLFLKQKSSSMKPAKKKINGLLQCLAYEATGPSRTLLNKHGIADPKSHEELEVALAKLYQNSVDKRAMDMEFCAIHPHRDFILRYSVSPKSEETNIEAPNGALLTEDKVKEILKQYIGEPVSKFSNCEGNPNCGCGKSGFAGAVAQPAPQNVLNTTNVILGVLGIVAITGILMHYKK